MTDDDQAKAEELLEEAKAQSRKDTEPAADDGDDRPELEDAIADAYQRIDDGDLSSNLTLRDENLAALFHGLEDAGHLADIGYDAAAILDREPENVATRAAALRLLVRIGLEEIDESIIESGKEGRRRYLESDEF